MMVYFNRFHLPVVRRALNYFYKIARKSFLLKPSNAIIEKIREIRELKDLFKADRELPLNWQEINLLKMGFSIYELKLENSDNQKELKMLRGCINYINSFYEAVV